MKSGKYDSFIEEYRNTHRLMRTPEMHLKAGSGPQELVDGGELNEENISKPILHFLPNGHPEVRKLVDKWVEFKRPLTAKDLEYAGVKMDLIALKFLKSQGRLKDEELRALEKNGIKL